MYKKLSLIAIVLILACMAFAQNFGLDSIPSGIALPRDPELISGQLENGFKYHIKANKKPENRVALRLFIHAGSVLEDEDQLGLAHFTEHMLFQGTKNFTRNQLRDYLNSIGMGFAGGLNAYTSLDETVYQLSSPTDNPQQLRRAFTILSDWAHQATFPAPELESERGVIIEEWRGGQGSDTRLRDKINRVLMADSKYAERMPIGTYEVISTFKRDEILRFYQDWYRPDMQELIIVGDIDPMEMEALVKEFFAPIPMPEKPRERHIYPIPGHVQPRAVIATDPEASDLSISLTWKHEPVIVHDLASYLYNLLDNLHQDMLAQRFNEIAEQADPPFSQAYNYLYNVTRSRSIYAIAAVISEKKIEEALQSLLIEAERVKQHGFTPGELDRAKQRILRRLERQMTDQNDQVSERLVWKYVNQVRQQTHSMSPTQEYQIAAQLLPAIGVELVNLVAERLIIDENLVVSITGPEKQDLVYPREDNLLAKIAQVKGIELEPYQDDILDEPLLAEIPIQGSIIKESTVKGTGVKVWTLSNGIKVYHHKTNFKQDEIMLSARRAGGYSLYPATDVFNAKYAGNIIQSAGFGSFDQTKLQKALSGTIAYTNFSIDLYSENISASSSPKDMELMFQMIYQYVNAPRKDKDSFASFISRSKAMLENKMLSPDDVFMDSVMVFLSNANPYLVPDSMEELLKLNQDRIYEIFTERFGDFSGFEFVIVGNFDEDQLKAMCEIYLANLPIPKKPAKPGYRNVRKPPVKGFREKIIYIGQDFKTTVFARMSGSQKYSLQEKLNLDALMLLANERLSERIREEQSGVYMIAAYNTFNKHPISEFTVNIYMMCSPERYEELNAEILKVLDEIKNGEITAEEASFVRTTMQRNYEQSLISNRYWVNNLLENLWNQQAPAAFLSYPDAYARISPASLKKTAKKYLIHDKSLIRAIKLPLTMYK